MSQTGPHLVQPAKIKHLSNILQKRFCLKITIANFNQKKKLDIFYPNSKSILLI